MVQGSNHLKKQLRKLCVQIFFLSLESKWLFDGHLEASDDVSLDLSIFFARFELVQCHETGKTSILRQTSEREKPREGCDCGGSCEKGLITTFLTTYEQVFSFSAARTKN